MSRSNDKKRRKGGSRVGGGRRQSPFGQKCRNPKENKRPTKEERLTGKKPGKTHQIKEIE
jgi:hypothetical protein